MIEYENFAYLPIGKALENQTKSIKDQALKQEETIKFLKLVEEQKPKSIEDIFVKEKENNYIKTELNKTKTALGKIYRKNLIQETSKYICNFQQFEMIRYLGKNITTDEADEKQTNPLKNIVKVNSKARTRTKKDKEKKRHF